MAWLRRRHDAPSEVRVTGSGGDACEPARAQRARWELAEGTEIAPGRHVLRRLGGGTRYEVFLVWDEELFALAVAKVLRPDVASDARALHELRREADLLESLAHPCLVRGFGAVRDGPRPHLVLEHVEGPTLGKLIARHGALALDQLLPLAVHAAAVLHYLASHGVVHLDVKPGNIVMSAPPRLIDLSIARRLDAAARLRSAIGTDGYMAPEQCAPGDGAWVGPPADVFGLGATLHHAAGGAPPFRRGDRRAGVTDPAARFPQLAEDPAALSGALPEVFRELVRAMLARDPAARPSAREVVGVLGPLVVQVPERLAYSRRRGLIPP
jgi:serine/threonine protein kinase